MDDDRGTGTGGAPPPPPAPSGGTTPPPPPPDAPQVGSPAWGPSSGTPAPQGWVRPDDVPAEWGVASPSAQVEWDRPAPGNNGCLRACLIVGGILVVLVIVGVIAASVFVGQLVEQVQEDPDALFGGECQLVSSVEVSDALGRDVQVRALEGLLDQTMGALLDKRLLPDATDCWVTGVDGTAGRIAVVDAAAETVFANSRAEAEASFLLTDIRDIGDEAFCTTIDQQGSAGILVRFGQRVAYVSLLDPSVDAAAVRNKAKLIARTLEP